jgi:hypothetical protein
VKIYFEIVVILVGAGIIFYFWNETQKKSSAPAALGGAVAELAAGGAAGGVAAPILAGGAAGGGVGDILDNIFSGPTGTGGGDAF